MNSDRWILLRKDINETFYAFDTTSLPDGDYVFRLIASDADANPDDPKTTSRDSAPIRIDNTPPVIRRLEGSEGILRFEAADAASPILEAEYSVDAKEWVHVEPEDGLSDSPTETYRIRLAGAPRGGLHPRPRHRRVPQRRSSELPGAIDSGRASSEAGLPS